MCKGDWGELKNCLTSIKKIKKTWERGIMECRFKTRKAAGRIERNPPCGIRATSDQTTGR